MIRVIIIGIWLICLAFSSCFFGIKSSVNKQKSEPIDKTVNYAYERTDVINVPVIEKGNLKGYVIAQFVYIADDKIFKKLGKISVSEYINDALLSRLYKIYYSEDQLDQLDMTELKKQLLHDVNSKFDKNYIKGIIVSHFGYYSVDLIEKAMRLNKML